MAYDVHDLLDMTAVREDLKNIAFGLHGTGDHHAESIVREDIERLDRVIEHTKARLGNTG